MIVFFDGMKVVIWLRIERVQRIIAIQGVSLVRILNHPSLDRSVRRDSKYPLTQSVGRENLSLPHSLVRGGFMDPHSLAPQYYLILAYFT